MSESDNKVFDFGIGGFSQGHSSLEIRGDGDAYSYRHSASFLADTEEHRGGARQVEGRRAHGIPPRPRRLRLPRGLAADRSGRRTQLPARHRCLRARKPEYVSHGDILAQHGPEFDIEQIANRDMSEANAKLLVSFIIAVARYDHRRVARVDTF